jgi:cell division protein FtsZ
MSDTGRQRVVMPPLAADASRQQPSANMNRPMTPPPLMREPAPMLDDVDESDFELDNDALDMEDSQRSLPVPEPEAQPLQRQAASQRQVRRIDRNPEPQRRNAPSGDVIDIPAFLRKR